MRLVKYLLIFTFIHSGDLAAADSNPIKEFCVKQMARYYRLLTKTHDSKSASTEINTPVLRESKKTVTADEAVLGPGAHSFPASSSSTSINPVFDKNGVNIAYDIQQSSLAIPFEGSFHFHDFLQNSVSTNSNFILKTYKIFGFSAIDSNIARVPNIPIMNNLINDFRSGSQIYRKGFMLALDESTTELSNIDYLKFIAEGKAPVSFGKTPNTSNRDFDNSLFMHDLFIHAPGFIAIPDELAEIIQMQASILVTLHSKSSDNLKLVKHDISNLVGNYSKSIDSFTNSLSRALENNDQAELRRSFMDIIYSSLEIKGKLDKIIKTDGLDKNSVDDLMQIKKEFNKLEPSVPQINSISERVFEFWK